MRYLLLPLLFSAVAAHAQVFSDLTAVQFGDSILLNWTLKGGSSCFDMHLQRSADGEVFEQIYAIGGTCGASDDLYYQFVDTAGLVSGTTYQYRVEASGGTYISETAEIRYINAGIVQVFVYPNPVEDELVVTIDNQFTPSFLVEWYTWHGALMEQSLQKQNLFTISTSNLSAGAYLLKVTTLDGAVFGKKVIVQ